MHAVYTPAMKPSFLVGILLLCVFNVSSMQADTYVRSIIFDPLVLGLEESGEERIRLRNVPPGPDFILVENASSPFRLDAASSTFDGNVLRAPNGEARIVVRFMPLASGPASDSIIFVRQRGPGPDVDRIVIRLSGLGLSLSRTARLAFGSVAVGDSALRTERFFRQQQSGRFRWTVSPALQAPFFLDTVITGILRDSVVISFKPTTAGPVSSRVRITRYLATMPLTPLDTITIELSGIGVLPPPPTIVVSLEASDTIRAAIGDTVRIPVRASAGTSQVTFILQYNPTILVPVGGLDAIADKDSMTCRMIVPIDASGRGDLVMVAVAGDNDRSSLLVRSASAFVDGGSEANVTLERTSTVVLLTNVWNINGQPRYLSAAPVNCTIAPNPVTESATVTITDLPTVAQAHLVLVDAVGRVVATFSNQLRAPTTTFTISVPALNLLPGAYVLRLTLHAGTGEYLQSMVRHLVVQ